ncbi:hypothetical protein HZA73_04605 [candidate division TA06 bacterium]|nr:hypothetical protein [candidate division TA06 bacterium]
MNFSLGDFVSTTLITIGGVSAVVFGLATWLGKVWAERILTTEKHKIEMDFEKVKQIYLKEIEEYKTNLERLKAYFPKYSENQFKIYQEIWLELLKLKRSADSLWEHADRNVLEKFIKQIEDTKNKLEEYSLLIENKHYDELFSIINDLQNYSDNKGQIIKIRTTNLITSLTEENTKNSWFIKALNKNQIERLIESNKALKNRYEVLINQIRDEFREQIKGSQ